MQDMENGDEIIDLGDEKEQEMCIRDRSSEQISGYRKK